MRLRNNPKFIAVGDGNSKRQTGVDSNGFATCPMGYEFHKAKWINVRLVFEKACASLWVRWARGEKQQQIMTTNGTWQRSPTPYRKRPHSPHD